MKKPSHNMLDALLAAAVSIAVIVSVFLTSGFTNDAFRDLHEREVASHTKDPKTAADTDYNKEFGIKKDAATVLKEQKAKAAKAQAKERAQAQEKAKKRQEVIARQQKNKTSNHELKTFECTEQTYLSIGVDENTKLVIIPALDSNIHLYGEVPARQVRETKNALNFTMESGATYTLEVPDSIVGDIVIYDNTNKHHFPHEVPPVGSQVMINAIRTVGNLNIYEVDDLSIAAYVYEGTEFGRVVIEDCNSVDLNYLYTRQVDVTADADELKIKSLYTVRSNIENRQIGGGITLDNIRSNYNTFAVHEGTITYNSIKAINQEKFELQYANREVIKGALPPNHNVELAKGVKGKTVLRFNGPSTAKVTFKDGEVREAQY